MITHWFDKLGVGVIKLTGAIKKGDKITIKKGDTELFEDTVTTLQIDHMDVEKAGKGDDAALKLSQKVREGATVYLSD